MQPMDTASSLRSRFEALKEDEPPLRVREHAVSRPAAIAAAESRFTRRRRESGIDSSRVVEKPTTGGTVTSLELLAADGGTIARFFGKRKPSKPEREDWREIVRTL